ncbi:MAG: hypothetical protein IJX18_03960 [Clostridia bacterium]|nr:hypothetical protein [Clostridia bacterium]
MSIGKSSIKRAANNGYSNVKSSAPDMENSVVVEEKAPVAEVPVAPVEEVKAPAKAKKPAAKKPAAKKAANKAAEKAVCLGDDMPYYLL